MGKYKYKQKMKIQSKKISKTPLILVVIAVVLLVASILSYVYIFNGSIFGWSNHYTTSNDTPATNLDMPTDEQIKAGNDIKKGNLNESKNNKGTPSGSVGQSGDNKESVEVTITAANQNSGTLQIRTQISKVVNTGQCTIRLTKSGKTVTKTADIQSLASTSTCKGFDIPVSELSAGSWNAILTYESATLSGTASTIIAIQ